MSPTTPPSRTMRESTDPAPVEPGLVSVVVPCLGRPDTMRRCLASLLWHTRRPWHLVAVARGDRDPIGAYFK